MAYKLNKINAVKLHIYNDFCPVLDNSHLLAMLVGMKNLCLLALLFLSSCALLDKRYVKKDITVLQGLKDELKKENQSFQSALESDIKRTIRSEIIPELREVTTHSYNLMRGQKKIKEQVYEKTLIGRVEWISTVDPLVNFRARVDTGAQTNSVHAEDIKEILKDGKNYVEFTTYGEDGVKHRFLKEIVKKSKVKSTSGVSEVRYVVQLEISFGGKTIKSNVNLNNRDSLRHNFLIGRNLLLGHYIIDVSQSRLLGAPKEDDAK